MMDIGMEVSEMIVRACLEDAQVIAELAAMLWDGNEMDELVGEFRELIGRDDCAVFLAFAGSQPVGFAQCQMRRDYVEGTKTSPVGYLEGIFVRTEFRGKGRARALLAACETWSREMGCSEFASDCELDNEVSREFHMRMGFIEANRIICFTKKLAE